MTASSVKHPLFPSKEYSPELYFEIRAAEILDNCSINPALIETQKLFEKESLKKASSYLRLFRKSSNYEWEENLHERIFRLGQEIRKELNVDPSHYNCLQSWDLLAYLLLHKIN